MKRVAIMVICWNNSADVMSCVDSLLKQTAKHISVLIIDNDSDKKTRSTLISYVSAKADLRITYLQNKCNAGTAGGFNYGIRWALENKYDAIGTLNADAIADKDWVQSLTDELHLNDTVGIVTGLMLRKEGKTIDTTGEAYSTWGIPGPILRNAPKSKAPGSACDVFASTGGGFIAKTEMFKDVGYFDENYFMYFEDVDISFRAQLTGWKVRYTPYAIAYHKVGASSSTVPGLAVYNTFKNLPMLFVKNVPLGLWPSMYPRFILTYILILGNAVKNGQGKYALKGWAKSWLLIPHMFKERWRIQKNKTVSTDYINGIILHDIPPEQTGMRKFRAFFTGKQ